MLVAWLGGISLFSAEGATMELEDLSTLLQASYRALYAFGVHQDESNLSNFRLVGGLKDHDAGYGERRVPLLCG